MLLCLEKYWFNYVINFLFKIFLLPPLGLCRPGQAHKSLPPPHSTPPLIDVKPIAPLLRNTLRSSSVLAWKLQYSCFVFVAS